MRKSVYVETTIPSAYVSRRVDVRSLARRQDTRDWWSRQREHYNLVTSRHVLDELMRAEFPGQAEAVRLMDPITRLDINADVIAIARVYVEEKLMPGPPDSGDAIHLAVAAYHGVDFVLTWNVQHLANPNKLEHMIVINRRLALLTPRIMMPYMLWWEA